MHASCPVNRPMHVLYAVNGNILVDRLRRGEVTVLNKAADLTNSGIQPRADRGAWAWKGCIIYVFMSCMV